MTEGGRCAKRVLFTDAEEHGTDTPRTPQPFGLMAGQVAPGPGYLDLGALLRGDSTTSPSCASATPSGKAAWVSAWLRSWVMWIR